MPTVFKHDRERFNTMRIPKRVLVGDDPKYKSVGAVYRNRFLQRFLQILNASFWLRANGNADDTGEKWEPLKPITEKIKTGQIPNPFDREYAEENEARGFGEVGVETGPHVTGVFTKNQYLTPWQQKRYQKQFDKYRKTKDRYRAKVAALKTVDMDPDVESRLDRMWGDKEMPRTPILVRTGRLVAATHPGTFSGNRLYAGPDQQIEWNGSEMTFEITVPYADEQDAERPIIPPNVSHWYQICHQYAIQHARNEYQRLQRQEKNRKARIAYRKKKAAARRKNK